MYFGKPIDEWIKEHRNDTITLGEVVDACEKVRQINDRLAQKSLDEFGKSYNSMLLSAYAYFRADNERIRRPVDLVINILGERYGYPDDAPDNEEKQ